MALVKHNNNSISAVTSMASLSTGSMTLIKEQTASSSASISFVDGSGGVVLDSTYPIYKFEIINCHPSNDGVILELNFSTDGGSNYNVTKTTTVFDAYHRENDTSTGLGYNSSQDLAQSTANQNLTPEVELGNDNDATVSGSLFLYNPSSTTFVKHFMYVGNHMSYLDPTWSINAYIAGYCNTSSAVDAVRFSINTGNIDAGTIKLYGIKDS